MLDFSTLVRHLQGLPNGQDQKYINLAQELLDKHGKREVIGAAQAAFTSVNDRGRSRALAPAPQEMSSRVVASLVPCSSNAKTEMGL